MRVGGIRGDQMYLGVGYDPSFDQRNKWPGKVFSERTSENDVRVAANLMGDELSIENFVAVLSNGPVNGRSTSFCACGKYMVMYLTGHGGEEFLKFRNVEELRAVDFADVVDNMKRVMGFEELLVILDTCQADSFFRNIRTSGVIAISGAVTGQSSHSSDFDEILGLPLSDRFSAAITSLIPKLGRNASLLDLTNALKLERLGSTVDVKTFGVTRPLAAMKLENFFFS